MSGDLVGKKVLVEFNTHRWPIHKATYTYEGSDANGYFLRRKDGVQRYFDRQDIVGFSLAETDVDETPH